MVISFKNAVFILPYNLKKMIKEHTKYIISKYIISNPPAGGAFEFYLSTNYIHFNEETLTYLRQAKNGYKHKFQYLWFFDSDSHVCFCVLSQLSKNRVIISDNKHARETTNSWNKTYIIPDNLDYTPK